MKKIIIIISALIIALFGLFWIYSNGASKNTSVENKILSSAVSIPEKVLSNRFGFLGGQEEENIFWGWRRNFATRESTSPTATTTSS